jgi:hypothetical protein
VYKLGKLKLWNIESLLLIDKNKARQRNKHNNTQFFDNACDYIILFIYSLCLVGRQIAKNARLASLDVISSYYLMFGFLGENRF